MDSARASPTIGMWALASDSATDSGSEPGAIHGGVRLDGDGATIMTTITSASITSTSTTIGTMALPIVSIIMDSMRGTAESGRLIGAPILIRIPLAAPGTLNL